MKRIIVSLADDTYRRARRNAAERGTSLGRLVKDFVVGFAGCGDAEFKRLEKLQDKLFAEIRKGSFSASHRLTRDKLCDRKLAQ